MIDQPTIDRILDAANIVDVPNSLPFGNEA